MYRAILPDGDIACETFEKIDDGVEIYDQNETFIAFIPYPNLVAIVNQEVFRAEERSIM